MLVLTLAAADATAAEYGLGLSAKSDNGLVYFPIDVSPRFRVEPFVRYSTDGSDSVNTEPPTVTIAGQDTETIEGGAGLFGLSSPAGSTRIYYGARATYVYVHTELEFDNGGFTFRESDTHNGYRIAPTFGFEYLFNRHFTLGGEVAWSYERLEGDDRSGSTHSDFTGERSGIESFLILRYFF